MKLLQLQYFLLAAEHKNLSKAVSAKKAKYEKDVEITISKVA